MENDFIIVNDISLAALLKNTLEATGKRDLRFKFADYKKFTREELSTITKLKLENSSFEDISALEYCTNLKQLDIRSANAKDVSTNLSAEAKGNYLLKKNKITDYSVINKLKKLQFLTIEYEDNLETLDLSGMSELASVVIQHNQNLTEIKGLDSLTGLSELVLLKNNISKAFDISALAKGNLPTMVLDFDLYPVLLAQYPDLQTTMQEYTRLGGSFKWAENISNVRTNEISYMMMGKMDDKAKEILDGIVAPDYSDMEKICAIYTYIIQNVKYDHEALETSQNKELRKQFAQTRGNMSETLDKTLDKKQSSYNAILEGRSVCEGYTNMMHYLLKSVGIDSVTCSCCSSSSKSVVGADSDHAVIRVSINGDWYYFDPTWDTSRFKKNNSLSYFFQTKEEFLKTHSLSLSEDEVLSPTEKAFSSAELSEMLGRVISDRDSGKNKRLNEEARKEDKQMSVEELLSQTNASLTGFRQQYEQVATQIEALMKQNSVTPIANYQQQLNQLLQQRDKISAQISPLMESQRVYQVRIEQEKEEKHQATLFQIEQITGRRITGVSGYAINPDKYNGVPYEELKDTSQLRKEQGEISTKIDELWMEGEIDPKTRAEMKMALVTEYNKMVAKAPKPSVTPPTPPTPITPNDEYEQTQQQFPTSNSPQQQAQSQPRAEKVESIDDDYRRKYNYDSMSDSEKVAFDRKLEEQKKKRTTPPVEKTDKEKLEEQRRNLRRQQFAEKVQAMGLDPQNFTFEEIMRQQEVIERMNRQKVEDEEIEEVEHHGMSM